MTEYVIGVDTGATKSHLALFDIEGRFVDFGLWGPLNYEMLPGLYAQFEDELGQFVCGMLSANGVSTEQVAYAGFGMAGVDTKKQHSIISQMIRKIGFHRFTLCNDAYLGILAGSPAGVGICAINGSGCTLAGIDKAGGMLQIGGLGAISADVGGGGYMGERAVAAVYSELFRKGEATLMTHMLFERLGVTSKYDYMEEIYEKTEDGTFDVHTCSPVVFEAVKRGDRVAAGILREIAASYADGIACMAEELRFPSEDELCIVLAGSVFVRGEHPLLIDTLKDKVYGNVPGRNIVFKLLDVPNVAGAVVWALRNLGRADGRYDQVRGQLLELRRKLHL
jgi:N-acetylglucosamine kinase-like BadF-type ATPase